MKNDQLKNDKALIYNHKYITESVHFKNAKNAYFPKGNIGYFIA